MHKLHIANTFFEMELENEGAMTLPGVFYQHPVFLQLQFLPLLYAESTDAMVCTDQAYTYADRSFGPYNEIESWGASRLIATWAAQRSLKYTIPDWDVVKKVNSKQFSFENAPRLMGAELLQNGAQAKRWLHSFEGPKVLKSCFGVSGRGHLLVDKTTPSEKIDAFLQREWNKGLVVVAEPWKKRLFDFSTQWHIGEQLTYIGATLCQNDDKGQYQFNLVPLCNSHRPFLLQHRQIVEPLLEKMRAMGYFGNVGVDAMVYCESDTPHLHPVVEINARKTMGYAALMYQQRNFPDAHIRFAYTRGADGLLPARIVQKNGKVVAFQRNVKAVYN